MDLQKFYAVLIYLVIICLLGFAKCSPPGPVVECSSGLTDCKVSNAYGAFPDRSTCRAAQAVFPSTEEELLKFVAIAVEKKQKMRVITKYTHSIPKLVCPGGDSGLVISTANLNHVVSVDNSSSMRMTVESGMGLKDLIDSAAEYGLALPHSPYWLGVTVGGMLGTGAHGSSLFGKGSAVHEYVVGMRMVVPASEQQGYAKVVRLTETDEDLNAAKVSLGVLGAISQVTFQLQRMFKHSIINVEQNDSNMENIVTHFGLEHEFVDLTWYPSQHKIIYRVDDRVAIDSSGDEMNDFIGFQPQPTSILSTVRETEEIKEATKSGAGKCAISETQLSTILDTGTGLKNEHMLFTRYQVIGYQNKMQSARSCLTSLDDGLLTACGWDPRIKGLFYHQTGMSIDVSKITQFLLDLKKLRDMNFFSMCGLELYSGILMRYVKASSAYLGKQVDSVDLDITYYRANDPNTPRLYEDVFEEIEQMSLFNYGALPHWGKNRNLAFDNVMRKYKKLAMFVNAKNKYDPNMLFSNEWTASMLEIRGKKVTITKDGCALEGLCVCSKDAHCAPDLGYFCEAGRVYINARVCRQRK